MAQDDGTLEAYCAKNNHKRVLVNVPALAQEVYEAIESEVAAAVAGGRPAVGEDIAWGTALQPETKVDDTVVQHGALGDPNSASDE